MKTIGITLGLAMFLALLGCESDDSTTTLRPICPPNRGAGLSVAVLDSLTGAPPLESVTVIAIDGAYVDTLDGYAPGLQIGAWDREGIYDLHVTASGYLEWTRTLIEVTADRCFVHTVEIEARLIRDPSGNLVLNGSFEGYGQGSLGGWDVINPAAVSAVTEGAPGAGAWSVQCVATQAPLSATVFQKVLGLENGDVVALQAMLKAFGNGGGGSVAIVVGSTPWDEPSGEFRSSEVGWVTASLVDTLSLSASDSVWVRLSAFPSGVALPVSGVLFDSIVLARVRKDA